MWKIRPTVHAGDSLETVDLSFCRVKRKRSGELPVNVESDGSSILFGCECGQKIKVPVGHAGAKGKCKACGRRLVVPTPPEVTRRGVPSIPPDHLISPQHRRDLEGVYSEDDLITYPEEGVIPKQPAVQEELLEGKESLYQSLEEILRYPFYNKLAAQIFLSGAILFSPLMWKLLGLSGSIPCFGIIFLVFGFIIIISIRLMYFSYLLLIIDKSAQGDRRIPELPLFQTWGENFQDLLKVLTASAIAFSPFLLYAASINIRVLLSMGEAISRNEPIGSTVMGEVSSSLGGLVMLYSIAAFYMPMVLMVLVVTKSFAKAVNPAFIFRSISAIWKEYLAAMIIIFLFLRLALTLFVILKDVLAATWFTIMATYIAEPIIEFYVLVVTMHVIGLLYYRNGKTLQW